MLPPSVQQIANGYQGASNPVVKHLREQAQASEARRIKRFMRANAAYYGQAPETLKTKQGKPNDNIRLNYARRFVNKAASFLFGKGVEFEIDEDRNTEEEEYLKGVWRKNKKKRLLHDIAVNGGIYGHPFVRIFLAEPAKGEKYPRIVSLDPQTVNVRWAPDDIDDVLWYRISSPALDRAGRSVTHRTRIEKNGSTSWMITEEQSIHDQEGWETITEQAWPYPFAPIVHCQNLPAPNEFWGMADLEDDVLDLIQATNFAISMVRRVVRYHGYPKTWARGIQAKILEMDTDDVMIFPNPQAEIGTIALPSDLGLNMAFFSQLRTELYGEAQMPEIALGAMQGVGALSGVALRILYQPLLDRNETKQELYGEMLATICERLLVISQKRSSVEDVEVTCSWPDPLPRNDQEEVATLQGDTALGIVSRGTTAAKRGYNFDSEMKKKAEEDKRYPPPQQAPVPSPDQANAQPPEDAPLPTDGA